MDLIFDFSSDLISKFRETNFLKIIFLKVYLEEIDDSHFEKYTMVRHIKSRLKTSLLEQVSLQVLNA